MKRKTQFSLFGSICIALLLLSCGSEEQDKQQATRDKQQAMRGVVKSGQIVIHDLAHSWGKEHIDIEMDLMNQSEYDVIGTLVFQMTLDGRGLDREWIDKFTAKFAFFGADPIAMLIKELERVLRGEAPRQVIPSGGTEGGAWIVDELDTLFNSNEMKWTPRFHSILSYIERGSALRGGMNYEPIAPTEEDYSKKFRKHVSLKSGEVSHITDRVPFPSRTEGLYFQLKIDGIEFDQES